MHVDERGATDEPERIAGSREFSAETIGELLRALRARAAEHPESPGLIASWPGVPAERMARACTELRRQGHDVREVSLSRPNGRARRGWALRGRAAVTVREETR